MAVGVEAVSGVPHIVLKDLVRVVQLTTKDKLRKKGAGMKKRSRNCQRLGTSKKVMQSADQAAIELNANNAIVLTGIVPLLCGVLAVPSVDW